MSLFLFLRECASSEQLLPDDVIVTLQIKRIAVGTTHNFVSFSSCVNLAVGVPGLQFQLGEYSLDFLVLR
jgi:hypothetical protein